METEPEKATLADLFRLMTSANAKLDELLAWRVNADNELRQIRTRMHLVEQQGIAFTEQGTLLNKRLDDLVDRVDRIEKKLDRVPV